MIYHFAHSRMAKFKTKPTNQQRKYPYVTTDISKDMLCSDLPYIDLIILENSVSVFTKTEYMTQIIPVLGICPKDMCTSV